MPLSYPVPEVLTVRLRETMHGGRLLTVTEALDIAAALLPEGDTWARFALGELIHETASVAFSAGMDAERSRRAHP